MNAFGLYPLLEVCHIIEMEERVYEVLQLRLDPNQTIKTRELSDHSLQIGQDFESKANKTTDFYNYWLSKSMHLDKNEELRTQSSLCNCLCIFI